MKTRKSAGITLIALVVTVIILLILAGVTLSLALNNNGLISRTKKAVELNEMAKIQEEAEMVKMDSQIGLFANKLANSGIDNPLLSGTDTTLRRKRLMNLLNEHFEGSTMDNIRITTADEKYDIIVRNNLEILVCKHGESYLKVGEMEIFYYVPEEDAPEKTIELYFELGKDNNSEIMTYEEYAEDYLKDKDLEETMLEMIKYDGTFDEWLEENNKKREDLIEEANEENMTYEEYLKYQLMKEFTPLYYKYYAYLSGKEEKSLEEIEKITVDRFKERYKENLANAGVTIDTYDDMCKIFYGVESKEKLYEAIQQELNITPKEWLLASLGNEENEKIKGPITLTYPDGETVKISQSQMYGEYKVGKNGNYTFNVVGPNNEEGTVIVNATGIQEDSLLNPYNFGRKINYVAKGDDSLIWRLFYANEDWVYLISSKTDGSVIENSSYNLTYNTEPYAEGSDCITDENLRALNGMWYSEIEKSDDKVNKDEKSKAIAWMMDQEVWKDYKDINGNAEYIIASPTLELYANSFNSTIRYNGEYRWIMSVTASFYSYNATLGGTLKVKNTYNHGIYNNINGEESRYWWIASPAGGKTDSNYVWMVNGGAESLNGQSMYWRGALRPIAIIPMNKFESAGYHMLDE